MGSPGRRVALAKLPERRGRSERVAILVALGLVGTLSASAVLTDGGLAAKVVLGPTGTGVGSQPPTTPPPPIPPAPSGPIPAASCNPTGNPTPSALLIPTSGPNGTLAAGGWLNASVEVGAVGYSAALNGTHVYLPSLVASFPMASGGSTSLYLPPRTVVLGGPGWSSPSRATLRTAAGLSFASGGHAVLSSQKIAVMADPNYGNLTAAFRWQWSTGAAGGPTTAAPWTVPTSVNGWPNALPSQFFPAPYASMVSNNGPHQTIGANFTAKLGAGVASRYFFLELEYPGTGKVVQAHGQTGPSGVSTFIVTIPMLNYNHYLYPGTYLVHIHDGCGAMLYSLSEIASYASSASVQISVQPASCGSVTLNGSAYASGSSATLKPSSTAYAFTTPSCSGHSFRSWAGGGGVHIQSANALLVSANGSFSVAYS